MTRPARAQAWIYSPSVDGWFILLPAFLATAAVFVFPSYFQSASETSPLAWLLFIVFIDVAHVYSTLYRTYFDREEFGKYRRPLLLIPAVAWLVGMGLYWVDGMLFWRLLAYLAVYHFVRQQYGFFSIYARQENRPSWERRLDAAAIYLSTIYPLMYWHTHLPRNYFWFLKGDFVALPWENLHWIVLGIYGTVLVAYLVKEGRKTMQTGRFNLPKNLILLGTALSWNAGIVWMNGDLAFTATNVVAHGIPYMALVWIYGRKKAGRTPVGDRRFSVRVFSSGMLPVFVGLLLLFAYLEEGLWDGFVWRDHGALFPWTDGLPWLQSDVGLAIVVPLLAVPQVTHYVIDGFIWRVRKTKSEVERQVFGHSSTPKSPLHGK